MIATRYDVLGAVAATALLAAMVLLWAAVSGCQSVRYVTKVRVDGRTEGAIAAGKNINDADPDGQEQGGAINVTVNVADNTGTTSKPIEISPGRAVDVRDTNIGIPGADLPPVAAQPGAPVP